LIVAPDESVLLTEASPATELGFVVELGEVKTRISQLRISFHVEKDGCAYLELFALSRVNEDDMQVVIFHLDDERYEQLLRVVRAAEDTVRKYRNSDPAKRMVEIYRL
jgi:hypothetical protein